MKKIESLNNDNIKLIKKLLKSSKERELNSMFVIEGFKLCYDAFTSDVKILKSFFTELAYNKCDERLKNIIMTSKQNFLISGSILKQISDTLNPQGILCIVQSNVCNYCMNLNTESKLLILEGIQDPSNMGTILRSAEAFGIEGVVLSNDCVDVYSPKVLRGSMGAIFRLKLIFSNDIPLYIQKLSTYNITSYATVPDDSAIKITRISKRNGFALVIGNEARGISDDTIKKCSKKVTIPMKGMAESLNAAVAASIAMWEMLKEN